MNFEERIEQHLEGLQFVVPGICCRCEQCQSDYGMTEQELLETPPDDEGGFSMHDCESCGSDLAGDRYAVHGCDANGDLIHLDVCCDCLFYLANN